MTFYELEKICKARKRRFYISIFLGILVLIGIIIGVVYKFSNKEEKEIVKKEVAKKEIKKEAKKEIKDIPPKISTNTQKPKEINKKSTLKFILPDFESLEVKEVKTKKVKSIEKNSTTSKKILEAKTIPSFETCINLAKRYLKEGDYKNAIKWAKFANIQNKKDPLSWIITAKALYKMGKKEEALKLLKIYDSYYNNKEVKKLIKELNGK